MKKITLLGINSRYTHSNLALHYLQRAICDLPYNVCLLEVSINQDKFKILAELIETKPDVVAISTYIWNRTIVEFLLTSLKAIASNAIIVLGGPEAGYNQNYWMNKKEKPDYLIQGGGEAAWRFLALNDFVCNDAVIKLNNIPFAEVPFPYEEKDFGDLENKYIYYEASRGCPFKCSFCLSSLSEQKLEYKSIEVIKQEIEKILLHNVKIIKFIDRSFNADRKIAREVWTFINSLNTKTKFHFEVHPALFTDEDFVILEETPKERIQFEIGVQSTNPKTISEINRNHHFQSYRDKLKKLLNIKNIHTHLDLIIGLPYEDRDTFFRSLDDLLLLRPDVIQLGFLKVLAATQMYEKQEEYQLIYDLEAPYQILQNKWLSFSDVSYFMDFEDVFNVLYNSNRLKNALSYIFALYENAVDFFKEFTYWLKHKEEITTSNWKQVFFLLRTFLVEKHENIDTRLLDDYLSWDWLQHSRKNNLPDFLDKQANHQFKRDVFISLKNRDIALQELLGGEVKNLNNCAFFVAQSEKFINDYLLGKAKVLLFQEKIVYLT